MTRIVIINSILIAIDPTYIAILTINKKTSLSNKLPNFREFLIPIDFVLIL